MTDDSRIIVALDVGGAPDALALAERLDPRLCRVKVGKELFTIGGPELLARLRDRGFEIFLDLKWHDIPNTVASACRVAAELGVWMVDVHASGGAAMMREAREALGKASQRPLIVGVTVLTSLSDGDLAELGIAGTAAEAALRLAHLAARSGLDGVVCSAREAALLRGACPPGFLLVTPGIRPAGAGLDDQQRVTTPAEAIAAGADHLVIGRPVTRAPDPLGALAAIDREVRAAVAARAMAP